MSQERARRQQGLYDQPTVFFRRAVSTVEPAAMPQNTATAASLVTPAAFAMSEAFSAPATPAPALFATDTRAAAPNAFPAPATPSEPEQQRDEALQDDTSSCASSLRNSASLTQVIVPAALNLPEGYDEENWQKARIAARPPRILVDRKLLSEKSRAVLDNPQGITLVEAIELHFELLSWGYRAPFNKHQKRKAIPTDLKESTVEGRLCEDHRGTRRLALDFWPAALGDEPVDEIHVDNVNDAFERFWRVPANHGKSENDRGKTILSN